MADYVVHFDEDTEDGTITRRGRLIIYHEPEGKCKVEIDGGNAVIDLDQVNQIRYQKWEPNSQEDLFNDRR